MSKYISRDAAMSAQNREFLAELKPNNELDESVANEKKKEFLNKMGQGDMQALNKYKNQLVTNTNYLIESQLIFADFLNRGTMETDQRTWYYTLDEPITDNKTRIHQITQQGNAPQQGIIMQGDTVFIQPYWISSEKVSMSRFNLMQGDITNEEKMRKRAAKGIAKKTNNDAKALLDNGLITDIDAVNGIDMDEDVTEYPSKTVYDLSTEGGLTMNVFKQILEHFMLLGKQVQNIYVPATRMTDLWDWMSMPAGYDDGSGVTADSVVHPEIQQQVVRTGTVNNLFGYPVNLIPVNTLNGDETEGDVEVYVQTTEGAGEYRIFPEPVSNSDMHKDAQKVYFQENRALAMFQTPRQRLNYAKFTIDGE